MLHTSFDRLFAGWQANFAMQGEARQRAGFDGLADLDAPANAHLVAFADHDALMERASLVVGHGTTMRALSHGLPIVGIPAKGADQVPITQLVEQWKVGRALLGDGRV